MKINSDTLVNMEHVIGQLALEYSIPILSFENLVKLGQRAVAVYGLSSQASKIPFADLCDYISAYIQTPFGLRVLKELSQ